MLLCLPVLAQAQSPLELFMAARETNAELKALQQEYYAAQEKAPQLKQLPNPTFGLGTFILPVETRLGAQRLTANASQMFPWFGTLQSKEAWAMTEAETKSQRIASQELALFYQIKINYYSLYQITASQDILTQNLVLLNALKALAQTRIAAGKASVADVLRVELKLKELKQEINILEAKKNKPLARLNQLLQRPLNTPISIEDSLSFTPLSLQKDTLLAHIQTSHPNIRMFELQQEAARKAILVNEKARKPSFGIGAMYALVDARTDAAPTSNGRDVFQLQATISIPLNRKPFEAKTREEHFRIEALENRKQESSSLFMAMIEGAYADHQSAFLRHQLYQEQIGVIQSAISILETDYSNEGKNFDELLLLEGELLDYELKTLQAIVQSQITKADIERYLIY